MTKEFPAEYAAQTADRILISDPNPQDRATAELLNYVSATWEKQHQFLREHVVAVARAIDTRLP
jgi:hypothetical protein